LLSAIKTGVSASYTYDPRGRRVGKSVNGTATEFLSDGAEEIAEYAPIAGGGDTLLRRYVPGPGTDQPIVQIEVSTGEHRYFHADRLGSIIATAGSGTEPDGPITYDPYGQASVSTGTPFKFTGRRLDPETGLYYYRARYYSPTLGRFLQTDPIGYGDGPNWYMYARDNSVNFIDPSGLDSFLVCRKLKPAGEHCFVVVTNKDGTVRQMYSYGPETNDRSRPGKLVETQTPGTKSQTALDDQAAWKGGQGRVDLTERGLKDDDVIAAGNKVDGLVGTAAHPGPTNYDFAPTGKGSANSNSGAARLLEEAEKGSSKEKGIRPSSGDFRLGWDHPEWVGTSPGPPPDLTGTAN
jgi:RHS repeat-associated protein